MNDILSKIGVNINVTFALIFFSLLWVRVLGMAIMIPFLFGKPVPKYVVVGSASVLAIFLFPYLMPATQPDLTNDFLMLFMLYLKEAFYGIVMGFSVAIFFYGFQAAGQMIDGQRGMSIARSILPQLGEQSALSGILLFQMAVVLYLSFGGHLVFLDSFMMSYKALPVLEFPQVGPGLFPLMDLFARITGEVLYIAVQIAAPIMIAIFVADIILGLSNRIAPQIDVWMLGFNIKGYVGILLFFTALGMIGNQVYNYTQKSVIYVETAKKLLEGKPDEVQLELDKNIEDIKLPMEVITK
ncbi:MAG: flagellar biosynthetic protein FliR [Pseudomonadota bacterium]